MSKHECVVCEGTGCKTMGDVISGDVIYSVQSCDECNGNGIVDWCQCHAYCACECMGGAWDDMICNCWEA